MDWKEVNKRINDLPGCPVESYGQFCKICNKQIPMNKNVEFCGNCEKSMKRNGFVRVVRCKDCWHRDPERHTCRCGTHEWVKGKVMPVEDDFFCAEGERWDENHK